MAIISYFQHKYWYATFAKNHIQGPWVQAEEMCQNIQNVLRNLLQHTRLLHWFDWLVLNCAPMAEGANILQIKCLSDCQTEPETFAHPVNSVIAPT